MKIVIKVGGSISMGEFGPDFSYFSRLIPVLGRIKKKHQLIVAIGGGSLTRKYGKSIEKFELNDAEKEKIFIQLIKANVMTLSSILKMKPISSIEEIDEQTSGVIGGIAPGRSTDANAAIAAEIIGADLFIKMTNVDGVYDNDPNRSKRAMVIDSMKFSQMKNLIVKGEPNSYGILDATAISVLSKAKIKTVILNGRNPEDLEKVIAGKKIGTTITA
jgi:uridylate kinase